MCLVFRFLACFKPFSLLNQILIFLNMSFYLKFIVMLHYFLVMIKETNEVNTNTITSVTQSHTRMPCHVSDD